MRKTTSIIRAGEELWPGGFNVMIEIEELRKDVKSEGGIVLGGVSVDEQLGMTKEQLEKGTDRGIVAKLGPLVGKCEDLDAYGLQVAHAVYFERYDGTFYQYEDTGKCYILVREDLIRGYVTKIKGDKDV